MNAGTVALIAFASLVALCAVLDFAQRALIVWRDARLPSSSELRYCRDELELAVEAAIGRATLAASTPDAENGVREPIAPTVRRHIAAGVLEDLDRGYLAHAGAPA